MYSVVVYVLEFYITLESLQFVPLVILWVAKCKQFDKSLIWL